MGLVLIPRRLELAALIAGLVTFAVMPQLPHVPLCFYHAVTGHDCPGCGTTRAVFAILHGRFADAASLNLLGYLVLLLVARRMVTLASASEEQAWFNRPEVDRVLLIGGIAVATVQFLLKTLR